MNQSEAIAKFEGAVRDFADCIKELDDGMLLAPLNNWSPRDILAHLIGWNEYIIVGCEQIRNGELPFYDIDHGENFCKVNAANTERISSTDQEELLNHLARSLRVVTDYIASIPAEDLSWDFGVIYMDGEEEVVLTIAYTLEDVMDDYNHHKAQIVSWAQALRA